MWTAPSKEEKQAALGIVIFTVRFVLLYQIPFCRHVIDTLGEIARWCYPIHGGD